MFADPVQPPRQVTLAIPCVMLILACTAIPLELQWRREELASFFAIRLDAGDILENVVGYVPLGAVLQQHGLWSATGIALAVSLSAEVSQFFSKGRSPSVEDLAANLAGAVIGVGVFTLWHVLPARIAIGRRAAIVAAILATIFVSLGSPATRNDVEKTVAILATAALPVNDRGSSHPGALEAHWAFNHAANDVIPDVSGNRLDGILVHRPSLVPGVDGQAVALNGMDQWIVVPESRALRMTGSMTISAWINSSAFPRNDAVILSNLGALGFQLDTTVDQGTRQIGFKLTDSRGRLMARYGRTRLSTNRWYHVAGVYDAASPSLSVYLDGRLDNGCALGDVTTRQRISARDTYIGRRGQAGYGFVGTIDDVRVYSRALTPSEIAAQVRPFAQKLSPAGAIAATAEARDPKCVSGEPDARVLWVPVALGMVVAIACVGVWPWPGYTAPCLVLSLLSGLVILPSIEHVAHSFFRFVIPLLTLAGGASVVAAVQSEPIQ